MNCEQAQNLFDAYLDGELSPSLETELGAHRLHCTACRHELALMEVAGHVITADTESDVKLDDAFTDRLLACIEPAGDGNARYWNRRWWVGGSALAAAAAILVAFTAWLIAPEGRVAGYRHENEFPIVRAGAAADDVELEQAADALVDQVGATWNSRADSAQSLIELGQMTILQMLDRFGMVESGVTDDTFEPLPDSFDELAPTKPSDDDIEDL